MKNLDLKSALAGVLLTMLVVTFTVVATAERNPPAWEYKIVSAFRGNDFENALNNTAKDGREVVTVSYPTEPNSKPFAVMKKPIPSFPPAGGCSGKSSKNRAWVAVVAAL